MALFKSFPKIFFDDQFEMIQNYVKSILNELILDRGYYKKRLSLHLAILKILLI